MKAIRIEKKERKDERKNDEMRKEVESRENNHSFNSRRINKII